MTHNAVRPQIDQALLRELPRFFGGFPAAIQELLQNALRARATTVTFDVSLGVNGSALRVSDDGTGLDDPQTLMTAARSGWGPEVTEPAGLGALSLLDPDFARSVTYRSRDWQFTLTPEQFASGMSIPVERAEPVAGFEVTLDLLRPLSREDLKRHVTARRGYAPITVVASAEIVPPHRFHVAPVPTPAGPVWVTRHQNDSTAIWEHFPVDAQVLKRAVSQASPLVGILLSTHGFTLMVDPASGLRPKLPDRSALMDDTALLQAAEDIAGALHTHLDGKLRKVLTDLRGPVLREHELTRSHHQFGRKLTDAFLTLEGYVRTNLTPASHVEIDLQSDDNQERGRTADWVRTTERTWQVSEEADVLLLNTLRAAGLDLPYGTLDHEADAPMPEVTGTDLRAFLVLNRYDNQPLVALASTLSVGGTDVPVAVNVPGANDASVALVLHGTPEQAEDYLNANRDEVGGLLLRVLIDRSAVRDTELYDEDRTFSAGDFAVWIHEALIGTFFPERARMQERCQLLHVQVEAARSVSSALRVLIGSDTDLSEHLNIRNHLDTYIAGRTTEIERLRTEHRLA